MDNSAEHVPLNESEADYLKTIYGKRIRMFGVVYAVLILYGVYGLVGMSGTKMKKKLYRTRSGRIERYRSVDYEIFGHDLTDTEVYCFFMIPFELVALGTGSFIFFKRIYPLHKDIRSGKKEMHPKVIVSKSYFSMTGQYFLNFDDPNYMHLEVNADLYHSLNDGDTVFIPRAIHSKQVFEKNGRYTIM